MIYNTDLNKTAEGHRALAIVRRNEEVVKAKDSLGTTVYSILTRWTKVFSQEQKDEYAKNFTEMCRDHHRMKATDSAKLKRVFLTPRMAEVLEPFLRCRWARDLYIEDRITALIDVRMIRVSWGKRPIFHLLTDLVRRKATHKSHRQLAQVN